MYKYTPKITTSVNQKYTQKSINPPLQHEICIVLNAEKISTRTKREGREAKSFEQKLCKMENYNLTK